MALHPYPTQFIPHTPVPPITSLNMSTRRPPLANVPNATNSPLRTTGVIPSKRSRTGSAQLDIPYGQPPPKKQVVDEQQQPGDSKLFTRRSNNGQPSAFERRLYAAREKERPAAVRPVRNEKPSAETLDSIRQWQRHYRKAFPAFVFYFDSIPEDVRSKCSRQVNALGAVSVFSQILETKLIRAARGEILLPCSNPRRDLSSYPAGKQCSLRRPVCRWSFANGKSIPARKTC